MTTQSRRLRLGIALVLTWLALASAVPPTVAMACSYLGPKLGLEHLLFDSDLLSVLCADDSSTPLAQPPGDGVVAVLPVLPEFADPGLPFDLAVYVPADGGPRALPTVAVREVRPTAECPLNGLRYPPAYRTAWEGRRPLGIMIENHPAARPQYGLASADVVYEAVAEGGITRFLAVFYCDRATEAVRAGPVRSARTYFLDWISEYGRYPLYAHVGAAYCDRRTGIGCRNGARADALGQIRSYGWAGYNDLDEFQIGAPVYWRDLSRNVSLEHTMFTDTQRLWRVAAQRDLTAVDSEGRGWIQQFRAWQFADAAQRPPAGATHTEVRIVFWSSVSGFEVQWRYDPTTGLYRRVMGGLPHVDPGTGQQITAATILVQFQEESPADDGYPGNVRLLYGTLGTGQAKIIQNGQVIEGAWRKTDRWSRTLFRDRYGREVRLQPGKIWVETVPPYGSVTES